MRKILSLLLFISYWAMTFSAQAGGDMFADSIRLGVASSQLSTEQLQKEWSKVTKVLSKVTGKQLVLVHYPNSETLAFALNHGQIGLAYFKTMPAKKILTDNTHIRILAIALTHDPITATTSMEYNGCIIAAHNSPIAHIHDLNEKIIAYFDPDSLSNYIELNEQFNKLGIHVHWLKVASPEAAYAAILQHQADATGLWDYAHLSHPQKNSFKIIAVLPNLQNSALLINTSVISAPIKKQIQKALKQVSGPMNVVGFKPVY